MVGIEQKFGVLEQLEVKGFEHRGTAPLCSGTKLYNGNISSIRWKDNSQSSKRGYKLTYDTANRLTSGIYGEGDALSSNTGRYSESMSYDANGNVTSLTRYGKGTLMDNLTIAYTGNQPTSVSESAADNNTSESFEYKKAKGSGYRTQGDRPPVLMN